MLNIPKIVRERLRAAASAVNHPDADVLTAFAERALRGSDRDVVLDHLACCGDCRDIVALALPTAEPVQAMLRPAPSRSGWLTWPALRWAFVAAGIAAITSFGVLRYQGRFRAAPVASKQSPAFKVAANERPKQPLAPFVAPAPSEKTPTEEREKFHASGAPGFVDSVGALSRSDTNRSDNDRKVVANAAPPAAGTGVVGGRSVGGPMHGVASFGPRVANNQWQQNSNSNPFQAQSATPPRPVPFNKQATAGTDLSSNIGVPAANETVEIAGAAPEVETQAANVSASGQTGADESSVARAKPPVASEAAKSAAVPNAVSVSPSTTPALLPLWTITSSGGLERSFDQGKTWQAVDVNASLTSLAYTDATNLTIVVAGSSRAKTQAKKEKDADKSLKQPIATPVFRAVAATGSNVWAGGSSALLYHSVDGGDHWARIVPAYGGASLTGDILSLEFLDPQHGKLSTSTAEVWITRDGGQTWRKQ